MSASNLQKMAAAVQHSSVAQIAKPRLLMPNSSSAKGRAVLLIHGYTGGPHDMGYLAQRLQEAGYLVSVPRLPGHGTSLEDFLKSDAHDWLRASLDAFLDLKSEGLPVHIAGLSMGGVLTAILAAYLSPKSAILAAPALLTSNPILPLTPFLKLFIRKWERKRKKPCKDPELTPLADEYGRFYTPSTAAELYKLQKFGRKALKKISVPVFTISSKKDKAVPAKVASFVSSSVASQVKEELILAESPHVVVNDCEKERVADAIIGWLDRQD
ncbi:alpha/beta hydrolase [Sediminispirochaeta bajacaliforniensis]|uniref:alpha/beta hydrolase n=1 Tax=Sediminispirochaeta bajacaliforniensis TaxID=148 RepID=UPI00035FD6BE|nr:alpha/beta fold hydrolase [Sediminispirochaeta bajacaliforniensis]